MPRSLPLAVALAFLAIAAPAQAQITGSTITTPADPHFALIDPDAPKTPTVSIAGTATGTGSVDIVCVRDYVGYGDVFASNVPVAADGTSATRRRWTVHAVCWHGPRDRRRRIAAPSPARDSP